MESNTYHTAGDNFYSVEQLVSLLKNEKERLVSLFLNNASLEELSEQYRRIDELNDRLRALQENNQNVHDNRPGDSHQ